MDKWTEGDWRVVDRVTNGVNGYEICWSDDGEAVTDHVYEEADAHLMAASKELYEALEGWLPIAERQLASIPPAPSSKAYRAAQERINKMLNALAKARGEQNG